MYRSVVSVGVNIIYFVDEHLDSKNQLQQYLNSIIKKNLL